MNHLQEACLDSWDRQAQIVDQVVAALSAEQLSFKGGEGENPIDDHLCHIHGTRLYWLSQIAPDFAKKIESLYDKNGDEWTPSRDLPQIRASLSVSAAQLRLAMESLLPEPTPIAHYSHPLMFMQHMIWHEGWHVAEILQALRVNGAELPEKWEETNVWGVWRTGE